MKGYKIYLTLGILLMVAYLVAQYNKPKPTNWAPTYASQDKIPFGTYILYHRMQDILPGASLKTSGTAVYNMLKNKNFKSTAYLIVTQKADISLYDFQQMKRYMRAGNLVFIASYDFGKSLSKELKLETFPSMNRGENAANFTNPNLKSTVNYGFEKGIGGQYFRKIDTAKATVLGINSNGKANFVKYNYGKGALYLITDPGYYTNYNLLDKYGAEYAAKSLSYLKGSKNLIYDDYFANKDGVATDILRVFFDHPELKWAYYLSILGLILFVLYDIKRRQRIIPVADPFKNSSVDFVQVVGSVYYQERNNLDIAQKRINYFFEHLRSNYYLKTNEIGRDFPILLMQKTGINEALARTLTRHFKEVPDLTSMSETQLITLNENIEQFYKNTQPHGAGAI